MAKQQRQTRPRPRAADLGPINPMRISCSDSPPPEGFEKRKPGNLSLTTLIRTEDAKADREDESQD